MVEATAFFVFIVRERLSKAAFHIDLSQCAKQKIAVHFLQGLVRRGL